MQSADGAPRITEYSVAWTRPAGRFTHGAVVNLRQDIGRRRPIDLVTLVQGAQGGTTARLNATLRKGSALMRRQAERAAEMALSLLDRARSPIGD